MIPLYNTKQVRSADEYAIAKLGMSGAILMENAARSIYESIVNNFAGELLAKTVGIVCGKGNNGGDGFALARNFIINGYSVTVIALASEKELKGDALLNYRILKNFALADEDVEIKHFVNQKSLAGLIDCEIIIDAILGTGAKGTLTEPVESIVNYLNKLDGIKVAIDIPTGLDADTATGETVFEADLTVSLCELKSGLFYGTGYSNAGQIEKGSIGINSGYFDRLDVDAYLIEPEDVFNYLPVKDIAAHKYSAGKVYVVAGSGQFSGCAFLSSNAVMKSGAGACTLGFPRSIKNIALQRLDTPTVSPYEDGSDEFLSMNSLIDVEEKIKWADCIAIGPGLGRNNETFLAIQALLKKNRNKTFVIDADALYALGSKKYKDINLANQVLTPHQKEFADLLGIQIDALQKDILHIGKKFASENKCYLVLKGAPTIIFNPGGEAIINSSGNPGMAKFGTGDVLTGFIAGMIAQSGSIEEALVVSVYLHSLAADLLVPEKTIYGITSLDILENLPYAIKFIYDTFIKIS
jgi:ADP-dependent NAD(P)H-hydrate dehydratase / NAD(P)H-hydrate epimerase